ncbi:MAG: metallopeptidase family protein [Acidobacteriota bacterium]
MDRIRFFQLVEEALTRLPRRFREELENLAIVVEDVPNKHTAPRGAGLLLGLFRGVPKPQQSSFWASGPSQIILYQKNIESICRTEEQVKKQIEITLKHEIGHYFGLSERDLRTKGY